MVEQSFTCLTLSRDAPLVTARSAPVLQASGARAPGRGDTAPFGDSLAAVAAGAAAGASAVERLGEHTGVASCLSGSGLAKFGWGASLLSVSYVSSEVDLELVAVVVGGVLG